jgi:Lysozyme like domain
MVELSIRFLFASMYYPGDANLGPPEGWTLKSSTQWFCKTLFVVYVLAIFWTSLAYAFEHKVTATSIPSVTFNPRGALGIRAYVEDAAKIRGINPRAAEWIVRHESRHHPEATGDGGESRGLWQINRAWHPEVSDACAYNVTCSTDWSLERIRAGHIDEWSTWKYCKERFKDCPFDSK